MFFVYTNLGTFNAVKSRGPPKIQITTLAQKNLKIYVSKRLRASCSRDAKLTHTLSKKFHVRAWLNH